LDGFKRFAKISCNIRLRFTLNPTEGLITNLKTNLLDTGFAASCHANRLGRIGNEDFIESHQAINRKNMKTGMHRTRSLAFIAVAILALTLTFTHAQTYNWANNAQGQVIFQPSNFDPPPRELVRVVRVPSTWLWGGGASANTIFDVNVTLNSLTIK
jgi:hypothetical protein